MISVGDLIDRGPQSADCLGLLRCRWFRAVRGNHEQMALEALESGDMRLWQMNGGDWYVKGDARQRADVDRLLAHCRRLPLIIEVECGKARHVIAHADYPAPVYRWQQPVDPQRVLWSRHRLSETSDVIAKQTREAAAKADNYVRENPWTGVGIGAAVGVVLGVLLSRR